MKKELTQELENTSAAFLQSIATFPQERFNTAPHSDSWSAAQVAEHLLKSTNGGLQLLQGTTAPTERDPGEKTAAIRQILLDYSTRLSAPAWLAPSPLPPGKEALLASLDETINGMLQIAQTADLTVTCMDLELPVFGMLTRQEWIAFTSFHIRRHHHQLNNIAQQLTAS